jgi:cytochrome P450
MTSGERGPSVAGSLFDTVDEEPWEFYERVRDAGGVAWDEKAHAWLVASYDLIKQMGLADDVDWRAMSTRDPDDPDAGMKWEDWMVLRGGPRTLPLREGKDHQVFHRWWMRLLSPKVLARWGETLIEPISHAKIDRFVQDGRAELVSDFTECVTPPVTAAVLGLPWEDEKWFDRFMLLRSEGSVANTLRMRDGLPPPPEALERGKQATRELLDMVWPSVHAKRGGDGDDFISMMWRDANSLFGEGDAHEEDIAYNVINAFIAGGSVANGANNMLYLVLANPEIHAELRAGDELIDNFVEEGLRLYSPGEYRPRRARHDLELGGVRIRKGELVIAISAAGNRDPQHYARAEGPPRVLSGSAYLSGSIACPFPTQTDAQGLARAAAEPSPRPGRRTTTVFRSRPSYLASAARSVRHPVVGVQGYGRPDH